MTLKKRLRVIVAALFQEWHERRCGECGDTWMAVGKDTQLAESCDRCRVREFDRFLDSMERRHKQGVW